MSVVQRRITGHVQLRRGKWHCVINLYNAEGVRTPKWINTQLPERGNKRKAEDILDQLLDEYNQKAEANTLHCDTFEDYMTNWLQAQTGRVEQTTYDNYENIINNHFIPYFKHMKLSIADVKPKHIRDYYLFKLKAGRKDGGKGGLATETLQKHATVFRLVFGDAVMVEERQANPADNLPIPQPQIEDKKEAYDDAVFLTADEADEVLLAFEGDILQPLILVTLIYGLRRSEVLGLKWDAIDFENKTLEIKHTVVKNKKLVRKDRTKSKKSNAVFALLPEAEEIFLALKAQKEEYKKLYGKGYRKSDYVFTWPDGRAYYPDYPSKRFKKVVEGMGYDNLHFHDLRHSTASILYDKGWEVKDIQEWMRHSDYQTTMNIYTHLSKKRKEILAKDMEGTFRTCKIGGLSKYQHPHSRDSRQQELAR